MDRIKLVLLAFGASLLLGACADMNMGSDEAMEPAAGPTMESDTGMSGSEGGMMDSDDDEGADSDTGGTTPQ